MKTTILLALAMCLGAAGLAQVKGNIELYGYQQAVSAGRAPDFDAETGLPGAVRGGKNHYLYAVSPARIYPVEVWIDGERLGVKPKTVTQTPVLYSDPVLLSNPQKILVPKTSKRVIQFFPAALTEEKNVGNKAKTLAQNNAVVLVYKQGDKFYYATLKELLELDKAAAQ